MAKDGVNPYAKPRNAVNGEAPDPSGKFRLGGSRAYSVPDIPETTDPDYTTGFSTDIANGGSADGTAVPSDIRTDRREPPENDPNVRSYWATRYSDQNRRYNRQEMTYTGWDVQQYKVPPGQNPLWTQERPPTRPTANDSPMPSMFTRYWHIPRNVKDAVGEEAVAHFSMADHRRVYQIMGQKPQGGLGVNTYRANPRPWDENLFVPEGDRNLEGGNGGSYVGNRSYRL